MRGWMRLAQAIDAVNERVGRVSAWLLLAMVLLGAYNAVARYLGRALGAQLSSNAYLELQWYLFSMVFLLGAAWALRHDAHVRVDVVYGRLSARGRAWVDLAGTLLFLLPFAALCLRLTWPAVRNSWVVRETSPDPGGLARYPIKALLLVAFALLLLQGVSQAIKCVGILRRRYEAEIEPPHSHGEGL